ncbi:hypothetical protein [Rhodospirillaceae bacterium SYSU D60014]|uniref:hypothetical protein n=1 Tax=Virgifigura deserti TaxID=2268457 RepID=UPI000E66BFB3
MLEHITFEKVEEVIRLAEQAHRAPHEIAADPQRGGPSGDHGVTVPDTPLEPQPSRDWGTAFGRYLGDLSDQALAELIGLYRYGHGDAASIDDAVDGALHDRTPHAAKLTFLSSQADLAQSLRRALNQV